MTTDNPVIVIESCNVPITLKPLPALLAPPSFNSSCGSFNEPTGILVQHDGMSMLSEPSPLPQSSSSTYSSLPSYYSVIQKQSQEIQALRQGLAQLNQKYLDQGERLHTAEKAQQQTESEIEDLSLTLFEQANQMVADEKKARFEAEQKIRQLEQHLSRVTEELGHEKTQLDELRDKLQQQQEDDVTVETTLPGMCFDTDALFLEFLNVVQHTPLDQVHRLPFMKQCLELDVEPCLRFGQRKSPLMKKLLETILHQPCFIEPLRRHSQPDTPVKITLRRASLNFIYGKSRTVANCCYTCGDLLKTSSSFRFKLKEHDKEWLWIDRSCRDRLVAVCNFYVFIRHVKLGLTSQKGTHLLIKECLWLRLCMFWARTGVYHQKEVTFDDL